MSVKEANDFLDTLKNYNINTFSWSDLELNSSGKLALKSSSVSGYRNAV